VILTDNAILGIKNSITWESISNPVGFPYCVLSLAIGQMEFDEQIDECDFMLFFPNLVHGKWDFWIFRISRIRYSIKTYSTPANLILMIKRNVFFITRRGTLLV